MIVGKSYDFDLEIEAVGEYTIEWSSILENNAAITSSQDNKQIAITIDKAGSTIISCKVVSKEDSNDYKSKDIKLIARATVTAVSRTILPKMYMKETSNRLIQESINDGKTITYNTNQNGNEYVIVNKMSGEVILRDDANIPSGGVSVDINAVASKNGESNIIATGTLQLEGKRSNNDGDTKIGSNNNDSDNDKDEGSFDNDSSSDDDKSDIEIDNESTIINSDDSSNDDNNDSSSESGNNGNNQGIDEDSNEGEDKGNDDIHSDAIVSVTISKTNEIDSLNVVQGRTLQLRAKVTSTSTAEEEVIWTSSDTSKATVSETGLVTVLENTEIGSKLLLLLRP